MLLRAAAPRILLWTAARRILLRTAARPMLHVTPSKLIHISLYRVCICIVNKSAFLQTFATTCYIVNRFVNLNVSAEWIRSVT